MDSQGKSNPSPKEYVSQDSTSLGGRQIIPDSKMALMRFIMESPMTLPEKVFPPFLSLVLGFPFIEASLRGNSFKGVF